MRAVGPLWTLRRKKDVAQGEASERDAKRSKLRAMTSYDLKRRGAIKPSMPKFNLPK